MHKNIKRFGLEGEVGDDSHFARLRSMYEKTIVEDMREFGYVPLIGYGPFWSTAYDADRDIYKFKSSVHGVYVGRRKAWEIQGITVENRTIQFPTTPPKLKESSEKSE